MSGDVSAAVFVIVGSGAAPFAAARAYRDRGGRGRVVMVPQEGRLGKEVGNGSQTTVGVLTYLADEDYESGQTMIRQGARPPG